MDLTTLVQISQATSIAKQQHQDTLAEAEQAAADAEDAWEAVRGSGRNEIHDTLTRFKTEEGGGEGAVRWVQTWVEDTPGDAERRAHAAWANAVEEVAETGASLDVLNAEYDALQEAIAYVAAAEAAGDAAYDAARRAERDRIIQALYATPTMDYTPPEGSSGTEQWRGLVERWFPERLVEEAMAVMWCESRGKPDAKHPESDATGLFQFLESTWKWASVEAGVGGYPREDPVANTRAAAWLVAYSERTNHPRGRWGHWECRGAAATVRTG